MNSHAIPVRAFLLTVQLKVAKSVCKRKTVSYKPSDKSQLLPFYLKRNWFLSSKRPSERR